MTFLTKSLPRRTVLRGLGTTLALPFLDAMLPPFCCARRPCEARRIGSRRSMCRTGWRWSIGRRRAKGRDFELSPILEPLAPFRNQMLVLSGIKANWNYIHAGRLRIVSDRHHARRTQRSRNHRRRLDGPVAGAGTSPRKRRWHRSNFRWTLPANAGACTGNLSCAYTHTLSWRSPTQPLPMEWNPRAVFEKLFGDSGSTERARARSADCSSTRAFWTR